MRHRIVLLALALVLGLPGQQGLAGSSTTRYESDPYLTTTKKPAPKPRAATKRTNFRAAKLNCRPGTMTWGDVIRCGYDYPPWALSQRDEPATGWWGYD